MGLGSRAKSKGSKQYHLSERIMSSIASKLTLWFLLLSAVPLAVFFIFVVPHVNDDFMNVMSEHATDDAKLLMAGVSFLNNEDEIRSVIVATNDENHAAFIIDKSGFYTVHPDKARINTSMYNDFSAKTTEKILSNNEGVVTDGNLIIGYYANPAQDRTGVVVMNKTQVTEKIVTMENTAIIQLSISLIIIALSGGVMIWFLVGPMYKLMKSAQEVGTGNLDIRIEPSEFDGELEALAAAFKKMVDDLSKSRSALEEHDRTLEQNVADRTKELDAKVQELTDTKTAVLNMMEDTDEANKELIKTHDELKESLGELKKLDVRKDEFISIAAHELKTPLTSIHGFSQLLQNREVAKNPEKREKYLKIMDSETKRLAKLVTDILDLSRIDLGTLKLNFEEVEISRLMEDMGREMNVQMKEKGLESEYDLEKGLPGIVTDKERLTEILLNLINNAIKYTPKGKITVKVFRENDFVHFTVKDTGIGIEKEYYDKLFQRFYQIDSSYTRKAGGTGLGLALCREFVTLLGGKIWLESEPGKGSEFHFTIPIKSLPKKQMSEEETMARERLEKSENVRKKLGLKQNAVSQPLTSSRKRVRD